MGYLIWTMLVTTHQWDWVDVRPITQVLLGKYFRLFREIYLPDSEENVPVKQWFKRL